MTLEADKEVGTATTTRKARLLHQVPLLAHVVSHGLCSERQLVRALELVTFEEDEYIYQQGQAGRDVLFIDQGTVLITQRRRTSDLGATGLDPSDTLSVTDTPRQQSRLRSQLEAAMEMQLDCHREFEYFGEDAWVQGLESRGVNAVACNAVACFVLRATACTRLLAAVHDLMLYRHVVRLNGVMAKQRIFQHLSVQQRQSLVDHCTLAHYDSGARMIQQGDTNSDRYFILVQGEADVVLDEPSRLTSSIDRGTEKLYDALETTESNTTLVCRKTLYEGVGEMAILGRPRTAHVVAVGTVICVVVSRKLYLKASQWQGADSLDSDAEARLAQSLLDEWQLGAKTRQFHQANPSVAHALEAFVMKFKAAYKHKLEGDTVYFHLLQRLAANPLLAAEFPFVSDRVAADQSTASLSITRFETRRTLSLHPSARASDEINFIARLLEPTALVHKFDRPAQVPHLALARGIGRYATFLTVRKDEYLFRQGKVESRAFLILRGKITIVHEDKKVREPEQRTIVYNVLASLSPGDSFGELSLVTRLQRSASALAACETDLVVFDRAHLQALRTLLPGVSIQHAMVQRAEFLATFDFLRDGDFAQCIRVAHDLIENLYDPRHVFLHDVKHLRTLFIVKRGEVAVYLRQFVPVADLTVGGGSLRNEGTLMKEVLVRVATIGPHEYFGVAVANAIPYETTTVATAIDAITPILTSNVIVPSQAPPLVAKEHAHQYIAATLASVTATTSAPTYSTIDDLTGTVYMCTTPVQMLELSELGWKRLSLSSLHNIRNTLLERHRWNLKTVKKQMRQGNSVYFVVDKPWQLLPTLNTYNGDAKDAQQRVVDPVPPTQLARRIQDKTQQGFSNASRLFSLSFSPPSHRDQFFASSTSTVKFWRAPILNSSIEQIPSFLSSTRTTQLSGSFPPKSIMNAASLKRASLTQSNSGTKPIVPFPRPPEKVPHLTGSPSPRRLTTISVQETRENPLPKSEEDYEVMWKLERRPFVTS